MTTHSRFNKNSLIARSLLALTSVSVLALPFIGRMSIAQTPSATPEGLGISIIPRLMMIQGQVKTLQGAIATVHTPAYSPPCQVPACTVVHYPATDVQIDTTRAAFQGPDGRTLSRSLTAGEKVVVTIALPVPASSEGLGEEIRPLKILPAVIVERDAD
jgi:hypothetical protein